MSEKRKKIAYFCMEYGLDKSLPLYAGGLGVLAGDALKAAHKMDLPLVGIGIRWWQNYTYQYIDENGYPYDRFPTHELDFLVDTGVTVEVSIQDKNIPCHVYKVANFNNAPLYLLDTGRPEDENGWITDRLYGGGVEDRIAQEIVLGIGGIRALRALNIEVDKYHFNEGHAAFAGIELIREKMENENASFTEALEQTRRQIVFTTHTPVPAGNESHNIDKLFEMNASNGLNKNQLVDIGGQPFNMTAACLHLSHMANGVSEIHGETARNMWQDLKDSAPIIAITNGVNLETWQNKKIKEAFTNHNNLWETHMSLKQKLVNFIKEKTDALMNPENLIIGFARRAAPYKRSELIFRDTEKIDHLLASGKMQLVFSGKAHPDDDYGKKIVATLVKMDKKYRDSIAFIENYDMEIAKYLTQGCDVWLNNPRRPLEASGTSGMKVALNGGLNLSVLDGWVAEGVDHGTHGWILDEVFSEFNENLDEDEKDLKALYRIIQKEVIPTYYENHDKWVEMMYASIEMSYKDFSAVRMLEEYYQKLYAKEVETAPV